MCSSFQGDSSFIVKPDTNLTLHIQRAHAELLADPSQKQPRKKLKVSVAEEDDPELLSAIALSKLPPQPQFGTSSIGIRKMLHIFLDSSRNNRSSVYF